MPLELPILDDRRFNDLVEELEERLKRQLPEQAVIAPGDPVHAIVDLFAWLTETILYRANLIPERQRRAFLNLLQIPIRPAIPARGIIAVDMNSKQPTLPTLLPAESELRAGEQIFSTTGELQPTPLILHVMIKEKLDSEELKAISLTETDLSELYAPNPTVNDPDGRGGKKNTTIPFRPRHLNPGQTMLSLGQTIDQAFYLAFSVPKKLSDSTSALRKRLAGITLNIGLAPADNVLAQQESEPPPRTLAWELAWNDANDDRLYYSPLELIHDSSKGGRQPGVARLLLPSNPQMLESLVQDDPQFAGYGSTPPAPPDSVPAEQMMFWIRLTAPDDADMKLGYLGVNCVEILGQGVKRDQMLGVGTGQPNQSLSLPRKDIAADSLQLDVEENNQLFPWRRIEHFAEAGADDRVYRLDESSGDVQFGDGVRGLRPRKGARIRAAVFKYGGGVAGNLPPGSIKKLEKERPRIKLRHDWPTSGGVDAETLSQAEQRIPTFLSHRNRAVTEEDFETLAINNPINPVARAETIAGLLPGDSIGSLRRKIPGVVSLFVLPPASPAIGSAPRPTAGLLKDVYAWLKKRVLIGTELYVLSPEFIAVAVSVNVRVLEPVTRQQTLNAVNKAITDYLWALPPGGPRGEGWPMGYSVDLGEIRTHIARVDGVLEIMAAELFIRKSNGIWQKVRNDQKAKITLRDYQLPELMAVQTRVSDDSETELPDGLRPTDPDSGVNAEGKGPVAVPTPVVPDLC